MQEDEPQFLMLSFYAGSSGRFLASIAWFLLFNTDDTIPLTPENAAHWMTPWANGDSYKLNGDGDHNSPSVYEDISWLQTGLLATHTFPDFDALRNNPGLEKVKVILITMNEGDYLEIAHNVTYKNAMYGVKHNVNMILRGLVDTKKFRLVKEAGYAYEYSSPELIPDDLRDRFLVIPYREIYEETSNGSYVALEKLKTFIGRDTLGPKALDSYREYVTNRNTNWKNIG